MSQEENNPILPETIEELFRFELKIQINILETNLEVIHRKEKIPEKCDLLMSAALSLRTASQIINIETFVKLFQALYDLFSAIKNNKVQLIPDHITVLKNLILEIKKMTESKNLVHDIQNQNEHFKNIISIIQAMHSKAEKIPLAVTSAISYFEEEHGDAIMMNLFKMELETQTAILNAALLELERNPKDTRELGVLLRSAHSIKGAAKVIELPSIVKLAHVMEDFFAAVQSGQVIIISDYIDVILNAVDILSRLSQQDMSNLDSWIKEQEPLIDGIEESLRGIIAGTRLLPIELRKPQKELEESISTPTIGKRLTKDETDKRKLDKERILRITAKNLDILMGLAGETLVESRWLEPFAEELMRLKRLQDEVVSDIEVLRDVQEGKDNLESREKFLKELQHKMNEVRHNTSDSLAELELFIRRHTNLSDRLYREVISSRMRPFGDVVRGFPRMVRDLARQLGKKVRLEITGQTTPVDRDILEKLETPLTHLIRNAVDHGIGTPAERIAVGKPEEGVIRLEAFHRAGMLAITISDDGKALDVEKFKQRIINKKLATPEMVKNLKEDELMDFIFLPGLSTSRDITEISGRGVGLNAVQNMVHEVGGVIRVKSLPGKGMSFHLQLPLTLSVIRTLLVEISKEPYAFPLSRIDQALLVRKEQLEVVENRQYFKFEDQNIGLVSASAILELSDSQISKKELPVIVMSDHQNSYGVVVDKFLGEKELVVQEIDPRLGKLQDISSGSFMEDGAPVLIIDVEDMVRSIDTQLSGGRLGKISYKEETLPMKRAKHVLVVDDSITVREVECRLLQNKGYIVDTAVNGIDGLNALRVGSYDLLITDIDMPRMNGIELLRTIRQDAKMKSLPVLVVSYKDNEEDRILGLEAGANYYLTKSSFHDESLINAVVDLIGTAEEEVIK